MTGRPFARSFRTFCAIPALLAHASSHAGAQATRDTVIPLPSPTGAFAVGTTTAYLTDSSRADADFPGGRPVTLQVWYPAARAGGARAPYLIEARLGDALLRDQYYGVDSAALRSWTRLGTDASLDAPPARGAHPLLAFSVGLGVIRANYTSIAQELASHGYVVALVESPLQGMLVRPDGREIADTAGRYGEAVAHRSGVAAWSRDISFALDRLRAGRVSPLAGEIAAQVDWSRIGALGHSSGGLVAVAACESDPRIRACVNMDGGVTSPDHQPLADFVERGVTKPTLFLRSQPLYDDTTLARRGLTREQWVARGEAGRIGFEQLAARSRGSLWEAFVAGTGHFSFTDAPFVMASAISRFGGRIIDARRGWTVITAALRAYFDRELSGKGDGLAAVAARDSELTLVPPTPPPDPIPAHDTFTVVSRTLGESRLINVYVPHAYRASPAARFPVLYMPDGGTDEDFPHVVNTVDSLIAERVIRPVIIIGIPNTQRRHDLTGPTRLKSDSAIAARVGGSAAFRRFIADELIPAVNARYRTTAERSIIGESLAGLFIVETLVLEPTLFDHYIALDPSIWWNGGALVDTARARAKTLGPGPRSLYLASSSEDINDGTERIAAVLRAAHPQGLTLDYTPRRDLLHSTIFRGIGAEELARALR